MKRLPAILLEMGPALTVLTAIPACLLTFHIGIIVKGDRQSADRITEIESLQSSLDHLRSLNWLLSRQLEREKQVQQLGR